MCNVLEFNNDLQVYLKLANKYKESGDICSAFSTLRFAETKYKDPEVFVNIAKLYESIEQPEMAIDYWFKVLLSTEDKKYNIKAYRGLGFNFLALKKFKLSERYYSKEASLAGIDLEPLKKIDIFEDIKDFFAPSEYKLVKAEKVYDATPFLEEGKSLLANGNIDEAIEQFLMVPSDSELFEEARCEASFCYYFKNQQDLAIKMVEEVFECNENALLATCHLASLYNGKDEKKADFYYKKLLEHKTEDPFELYKIAMVAVERKDDDVVLKLTDKINEIEDKVDILLYYVTAVANFNKKQYKKARKYFKRVNDFMAEDPVCVYYIRLIDKILDGNVKTGKLKPASYLKTLPESETKFRIERVVGLFIDEENNEKTPTLTQLINEKENIYWSVLYGNKALFQVVTEGVIKADKSFAIDLYKELFVNRNVSLEQKVDILYLLCTVGYDKEFNLISNNVYKKIRLPKALSFEEDEEFFKEIYYKAFSYITIFSEELMEDVLVKELYKIKSTTKKIGKQKYTKQQFILCLILLVDCVKDKYFWAKTLKVKRKEIDSLIKAVKEELNENS